MANDLYGTFGSVKDVNLPEGPAGSPMGVRANANAFGAQVGEATERAGDVTQNLAIKYQGMVNEQEATKAEAEYMAGVGSIMGKYKTLSGTAAFNASPQVSQELNALRLGIGSKLQGGAAHAFDSMAAHHEANYLYDINSFAQQQLAAGQMDAGLTQIKIGRDSSGVPFIARNDQLFGQQLGTIKSGAEMTLGSDFGPGTGLIEHPETGSVVFDENTPEGKLKKAEFDNLVDYNVGMAWQNRINAIANENPVEAMDLFTRSKDAMPKAAAANIEASLTPKVETYHANNATSLVFSDAQRDYQKVFTNPPSTSYSERLQQIEGTGQNPYASSSGKYQFTNGTWIDTVRKYAPQYASFSDQQILEMKKSDNAFKDEMFGKFTDANAQSLSAVLGRQPTDGELYLAHQQNVNGAISLLKNPEMNAIQALQTIGVSPQTARDSIVNNGGTADMTAGQFASKWIDKFNGQTSTQPVSKKPYATNADGSPMTDVDYYKTHPEQMMAMADSYAEQTMPGNLQFKERVREQVSNQMKASINQQQIMYDQDKEYVIKGIMGKLSGNRPPTTFQEMEALPGMKEVLDRVSVHSPEDYLGINNKINAVALTRSDTNSANAYEVIQRTLLPYGSPGSIESEATLARLLGSTKGNGINFKDYNEARQSLNTSDSWKTFVKSSMDTIANANGNVDGKGKERALQFYNTVTKIREGRMKNGVTEEELLAESSAELDNLNKFVTMYQPSRAQQVANKAKVLRAEPQNDVPLVTSMTDQAFINLPSGSSFKTPDGKIRVKK